MPQRFGHTFARHYRHQLSQARDRSALRHARNRDQQVAKLRAGNVRYWEAHRLSKPPTSLPSVQRMRAAGPPPPTASNCCRQIGRHTA